MSDRWEPGPIAETAPPQAPAPSPEEMADLCAAGGVEAVRGGFVVGVRLERVRAGECDRVLAADLAVAVGEIARLQARVRPGAVSGDIVVMGGDADDQHEHHFSPTSTLTAARKEIARLRADGGAEAMRGAAAKLVERHPRVMLAPAFAEALAAAIRALPIPAPVEPVAASDGRHPYAVGRFGLCSGCEEKEDAACHAPATSPDLAEPPRKPRCPSADCPMCSGEACGKCGAGCSTDYGRPHCEHDVIERHEGPSVPVEPETAAPDGDVLIHVREGCLVHVEEGCATTLPRAESVRLAGEVLRAAPAPSPDLAGILPPEEVTKIRKIHEWITAHPPYGECLPWPQLATVLRSHDVLLAALAERDREIARLRKVLEDEATEAEEEAARLMPKRGPTHSPDLVHGSDARGTLRALAQRLRAALSPKPT